MPFKMDDDPKKEWHLTIEPNGDPSAKGHQAPSIGVWLNKDPSKSVSEIVHRIYPHQNPGRTMFELSEQAQRWASGFSKGVKETDPDVDLRVIGQSLQWDQEVAPPPAPVTDQITIEALKNALQPLEWTRLRDPNNLTRYYDAYEAQTGGTVYQYERDDDHWSIYVVDPKGVIHETIYRLDYLKDEDAALEAVDAHRVALMAEQLGIINATEPAPDPSKPASKPSLTSSPSM